MDIFDWSKSHQSKYNNKFKALVATPNTLEKQHFDKKKKEMSEINTIRRECVVVNLILITNNTYAHKNHSIILDVLKTGIWLIINTDLV